MFVELGRTAPIRPQCLLVDELVDALSTIGAAAQLERRHFVLRAGQQHGEVADSDEVRQLGSPVADLDDPLAMVTP